MSAGVAEPMLEAELWISFTSLLRSYFAAATLDRAGHAHVEGTDNCVALQLGADRLVIACDPEAGTGTWKIEGAAPEQGEFILQADGRVTVDGWTVELDHAAIDLVGRLMRAGKRA